MIQFDSATWRRLQQGINDNPSESVARTRDALDMLGQSLASGAQLPDEAARWLGERLIEIAQAEWKLASDGSSLHRSKPKDANSVLGLRSKRGNIAQNMHAYLQNTAFILYLMEKGLSQFKAANIFAEYISAEPIGLIKMVNRMKRKFPGLHVRTGFSEWTDCNGVHQIS